MLATGFTKNRNITSIENEYQDITARNAWLLTYKKIDRQSKANLFSFIEGEKPENKPFNRYKDVFPFDHSRIVVKRCATDYINANLVKVREANRKYILTQGPLPGTVSHFWSMIWEQDSGAIVMLNNLVEKNENKCCLYWPREKGELHKMVLRDVMLAVEQIDDERYVSYWTRLFKLTDLVSGEIREVTHFHYTAWPDFGVPFSPVDFLSFLGKVRESRALEPDRGPVVVHCSAGIGRSGTFCLVDSCLVILEKDNSKVVNVQDILLEMRQDRMGLVQTFDQLRFSYEAIIEGVKTCYVFDSKPLCASSPMISSQPKAALPATVTPDILVTPITPLGEPLERNINLNPVLEESEPNNANAGAIAERTFVKDVEVAPIPPVRDTSLLTPPDGPLPPIPASTSMGELEQHESAPPELGIHESAPLDRNDSSSSQGTISPDHHDSVASLADDKDIVSDKTYCVQSEDPATIRRRRQLNLQEKIASMKKRNREAEQKQPKRSLCKYFAIGSGLVLASVAIYVYIRNSSTH